MRNEKRKIINAGIFYPLYRGVASRFLVIVTGCVLLSVFLQAQTTNDFRLNQLKDSLPNGWEMGAQIEPFGIGDEPTLFLFISRKDSVKVLDVNKINAPNDIYGRLEEKAKKEGRTIKLGLILKLEPKWSKQKFDLITAYDDSLDAVKKKLFDKYNIEELRKPHPLGKGQFIFDDSTPDKKRRLKEYNEGCNKLDDLKKPWPNYSSSTYSVFFYYDYESWQFHEVYPEEAEREEYHVVELINQILKSDF